MSLSPFQLESHRDITGMFIRFVSPTYRNPPTHLSFEYGSRLPVKQNPLHMYDGRKPGEIGCNVTFKTNNTYK